MGAGDPDAARRRRPPRCGAPTRRRGSWPSGLQVHGGIGFTWEHDLHLFLKRGPARPDALRRRRRPPRAPGPDPAATGRGRASPSSDWRPVRRAPGLGGPGEVRRHGRRRRRRRPRRPAARGRPRGGAGRCAVRTRRHRRPRPAGRFPHGPVVVGPIVVADPGELEAGADDIVLLTTKSQHSVAALGALAAAGFAGCPLVLRPERRCRTSGPRCDGSAPSTGAASCSRRRSSSPAWWWRIRAGRPGSSTSAGTRRLGCRGQRVAAAFAGATFSARAVDDVMRWKYRKLVMNLGNAVEAVCGHGRRGGPVADMARVEAEACIARRPASVRHRGRGPWPACRAEPWSSSRWRAGPPGRVLLAEPGPARRVRRGRLPQRQSRGPPRPPPRRAHARERAARSRLGPATGLAEEAEPGPGHARRGFLGRDLAWTAPWRHGRNRQDPGIAAIDGDAHDRGWPDAW